MNNDVNTSGNNPSGQSVTNDEIDNLRAEAGKMAFEDIVKTSKDLAQKFKRSKFENVKLKIENRILYIDKANLAKKYEGASDALKQVLQKIKDLRNDPSKKGVPNVNPIQVSIDQNNRFNLLGKIKSFKDNLESCKVIDYSYSGNNKNQQIKMYFMDDNVNTRGDSLSGQSVTNDRIDNLRAEVGKVALEGLIKTRNDLVQKVESLEFENEKLKTENGKLDIDKANLEKKYEGASNTLKQALQKIKNLQNDPNKKGASNINLIQVSVDQNNRFSLLGKIKSLKDNLKSCRAVEYSYIENNKNQETK